MMQNLILMEKKFCTLFVISWVVKIQIKISGQETKIPAKSTTCTHVIFLLNVFQFYCCFSVIGALLGTQDGRKIEIFNSFELQFDTFDDGQIVLNMEYYSTKEEQCKL